MHLYLAGDTTAKELGFEVNGTDRVVKFLDSEDSFIWKNAATNVTVHSADNLVLDSSEIVPLANALRSYENTHLDYHHDAAELVPNDPGYKAVHNALWQLDI